MKKLSKVIIVDDNVYSNIASKKVIQLAKVFDSIQTFEDPMLAFSYIQNLYEKNIEEEIPDLILVDLNMPEMSGWEFIRTFELLPYENTRLTDIKILTGSEDEEDKKRASALSIISAFITKPLNIEKVMSTLNRNQINKYSPI
ncbi:MAG TPA: response regulator [Cytophagales bacterium]|nr:response regulator [Cytophagales bacterium]